MSSLARSGGDGAHDSARWGISLVVVFVLHVAAFAAMLMKPSEPKLMDAAPPVALIDLEPLPKPVVAQPVRPPPPPEPEQPKIEEPEPPKDAVLLPKPPPPKPPVPRQERPIEQAPPQPAPATQVQSVPAPPQVATFPIFDPRRNWEREVLTRIDKFKRYPRRAQLRRQEGTNYLRFVVARNGDVLSYALQQSSGIQELDEETLTLIDRAKPLPPMPPEMKEDRVELVVPVRYTLR